MLVSRNPRGEGMAHLAPHRAPLPAPHPPRTTPRAIGSPAASAAPRSTRIGHWLALGAVVGPLLFTGAWLVLGFVSPGYTVFGVHIAPYSPITQPISGLGLGPTAMYMNAAFVLSGLILAAG